MPSISIQATDGSGSFNAYHAPATGIHAGGKVGTVVLIQEIFGVSASIREICDMVASQGFNVLAPDLFWRQEPGVDLSDKTKEEWDKAFALLNGFDQAKGIEDLKATLALARTLPGSNGRAGTMGFCLGGRLAFMMAQQSDADVNISYYGVGLDGLIPQLGQIKTRLLVHIAENDTFFGAEARAALLAAVSGNALIEATVYPNADHAFARAGGTHWDTRSAWIANGRSTEALVAALG